jgi:hypothetical protein
MAETSRTGQPTSEAQTKYITVTYLSDGTVSVESNGITVFDLWSLSNYLKMRADEMYVSVQTKSRMEEAARQGGSGHIQAASYIPESVKPRLLRRD